MTKHRKGSWWDTPWPGVVLMLIVVSVIVAGVTGVLLRS